MPLPGGITTCTVTGKYEDMQGNPMSGSVTFTPSVTLLIDAADAVFFEGVPVAAQLDASGAISVTLPRTDNTAFSPSSGWEYLVTENITGVRAVTYPITLPSAVSSPADLSELR